MVETLWYCYDRSGEHAPPYFDSRADAADACEDDEQPRPIASSVLDDDVAEQPVTKEVEIARGECPWCDEYEGDHVGRHASSAHPDAWDRYSSDK